MKISTLPHLYRNVNRWGEILTILSKYGLADWLSSFDLQFAKGWLKDSQGGTLTTQSRQTRFRLALTELGPTFIKLGQILSTRPDIVGVQFAGELAQLQSDVDATPADQVARTIESELGESVDELFDVVINSAFVGMRKPEHRIYMHALEQLGVRAEHVVFLDDN